MSQSGQQYESYCSFRTRGPWHCQQGVWPLALIILRWLGMVKIAGLSRLVAALFLIGCWVAPYYPTRHVELGHVH